MIKSLERIKETFDARFAQWHIVVPRDDVLARKGGGLRKSGWAINYRFGEEDGNEFLEYFASHRLTNDTLNRIYEDGHYELIDACQEFYPANDPQAEQEYYRHNQEFYRRVKESKLW